MAIRTTNRIHTAIAVGRLSEAERLLDDLRGEVDFAWAQASSEEERRAVAKEVSGALEWARIAVMASRAHDQSKLIRIVRGREYTPTRTRPDIVEFDA
jgi:hypothetical protein